MATSQPLVCTSLHVPPDTQPFQRIYEISWHVFAPNLDRLRLAVEEFRDVNPEAIKIFNETRIVLREELLKVFEVLLAARDLASRYLILLEDVEAKNPTHDAVYRVGLGAEMGMRCSNEAEQAFFAFRKELEKVIDRITTVTGTKQKKGSKSSLSSSQNTELVSEIYSAINECNGLLQQCHNQFAQLLEQTRNEHSIDDDPPSKEETQVMGAKWQTFLDTIDEVKLQADRIADGVLYESSDGRKKAKGRRKPRQNIPLWRALFQGEDKRHSIHSRNVMEGPSASTDPGVAAVTLGSSHEISTNVVNPVDATQRLQAPEDRPVPDTAPSNVQTTSKAKALFLWKVLRRTNTSSPREVSEGAEASDDPPVTAAPPSKVPFWRKLTRWATCVSITPFR